MLWLALALARSAGAEAPAPDLRRFSCTPGEQLSRLEGEDHRSISLIYHDGYLLQNRHDTAHFTVWSLSDPRSPVLLRSLPDVAPGHHSFSFMGETAITLWSGNSGKANNEITGHIDLSRLPELSLSPLFDFPDIGQEKSFYPLGFRGVPRSYDYEQLGTMSVHDMKAPGQPELSRIPILEQVGFEGRPQLIGNLLLVVGDNETPQGIATYDLSDPGEPVLLDSLRTTPDGTPLIKAYESVPIWGHYALLIHNGQSVAQRGVDVIDFSDPSNLRHVGRYDFPGRTRYAQFQDEYMFVGDAKVNMETFAVEQTFPDGGGEYMLPIGNILVTSGLDRPDTVRLWCHQDTPDTRPPMVTFHSPADRETDVAVTGRVGLVIPEVLDLHTVGAQTVILQTLDGAAVDTDIVLNDNDVLNVTPKAPLSPETTYQVLLPAGGLSDVAGNALEADFSFTFSTGSTIHSDPPPVIDSVRLSAPVVDIGETVRLSARSHAERGETIRYRIVWGDGAQTAVQSARSATHRYTSPGVYSARVVAQDPAGNAASRSVEVVVRPASVSPGVSSSSVAVAPDRRVWNVNPDNDTVSVTDADSGRLLREVPVAADPSSVAISPRGEVWVVSHDAASVTVLSARGARLASIPLPAGSRPHGLVLSPDGATAYVSAMAAGAIYRIDTADRRVIDSLPVGPWPRALALSTDGSTLLATRLISPDHQGEVYRIDTDRFDTHAVIPLAADHTTTDSDRTGRGVPNYLTSIAIAPDGHTAWVGANKANIFRGQARDGQAMTAENTVRAILAFIDLRTGTEITGARLDVDNHELATGIAFSSDGGVAYVSYQGNNHVRAFRVVDRQVIDQLDAGLAPRGLAVDPKTGHLLVHSFLSRTLHQLDLFTGPSASLSTLEERWKTAVVGSEQLAEDVLRGKRLFYDASDARISTDGYLSCASCHLDGGHDGRVWDFTDRGEGLRNTIDLTGKGSGHGAMHWSANFDEVQDFENDIRGAFDGSGLMAAEDFDATRHPLGAPKAGRSADLDALAAYLESLDSFGDSPHRSADGSLTSSGARGRGVFARLGCGSCHGGESFTDSATGVRHDVGTVKASSGGRLGGSLVGIDTPTLRGLWSTAPYLHDGSAPTLHHLLDSAAHGATGSLTADERDDLVAFLLQIDDSEPAALPLPPPDLRLTTLSDGETVRAQPIPLQADSSRPGGEQITYLVDDVALPDSNVLPYRVSWRPDISGSYRVLALTNYSDGTAVLSPELTIHVDLDTPAPDRDALTLLWQDDFDTLDRERWDMPTYIFDDSDAQHVPQMVRVSGGLLRLRVEPSEAPLMGDRPYTSGEIRTLETFTYGRFEARARFPDGVGIVSAFSMFYDYFSNTRPDRVEDWNQLLVSTRGQPERLLLGGVYWDAERNWRSNERIEDLPFDASAEFHIYAIEWLPDAVSFYLDEVLVHRITGEEAARFQHPSRLVMNIWPARPGSRLGEELGIEDSAAVPAEIAFDWVRVYAHTP